MIDDKEVNKLIDEAYINMEKTKSIVGKEIYQKRFKPVFEGYLTAMCTVLESIEEERTTLIKGKKE